MCVIDLKSFFSFGLTYFFKNAESAENFLKNQVKLANLIKLNKLLISMIAFYYLSSIN